MKRFKSLFLNCTILSTLVLGACSTNPATGQRQFTALMSPEQEVQVGASEHQKIIKQYGLYSDKAINSYVNDIGKRVTQDTERPDVNYTFYVLDTPIVNAFALPGGYIYVSRGLLSLANSEAEVAAVLAHEAGHITGRHSAERYSRGVVTTLGAGVLSAVLGSEEASQALGVGSNLYMSSYSRTQETEADSLGLRYMTRGGYDADAMPKFLESLERKSALDSKLAGRSGSSSFNYFSTHPATADRVSQTRVQTGNYADGGKINRDQHLKAIDGMTYGDSAKQGFARGQKFYHPEIGFMFEVPEGYNIANQATQVAATSKAGSAVIFDMASNKNDLSPRQYIQNWVKDRKLQDLETITVNGRAGATGSFAGQMNGKAVTIRLVAIEWNDGFARFQMAIPQNASRSLQQGLKNTMYSFRKLSAQEKKNIRPYRVKLFAAKAGDSVASVARRQPFTKLQEERFLVLNGLKPGQALQAGRLYKRIVE